MPPSYLLIESNPWKLVELGAQCEPVELPVTLEASSQEVAAAVAKNLQDRGHSRCELIVALDGRKVLAAQVAHQGGRTRQRHVLIYLLEEQLPLSAEEIVCDFVIHKQHAFGVAAELAGTEPLVAAFTEQSLAIRTLTPLPLLALQEFLREQKGAGTALVLWFADTELHLFVTEAERPLHWRISDVNPESVRREVQLLMQSVPEITRWFAIGLPAPLACVLESLPALATFEGKLEDYACREARRISEGSELPWIELKRDALGAFDPLRPVRKHLAVLAASFIFFLISLIVAIWFQASHCDRVAAIFQREQENLFRELFPGQPVPVGVRARLESEHRKLAGLAGKLQGMPQIDSALMILGRALNPLPPDLRFRILEFRADSRTVRLEGEVRQHSDADILSNRLREAGFEVEPPRTERLADQGVAYVISAQLPTAGKALESKKP